MSMFDDNHDADLAFDQERFWTHSLTVAIAAETLARKTAAASPEEAFTAWSIDTAG